MPSASGETVGPHRGPRYGLAASVLLAVLWMGVGTGFLPVVINTGRYIVTADATEKEDVYVATQRAIVEGTIDGDLFVTAGNVTITATAVIRGDLLALVSGTVEILGTVEGSVRVAAREVAVDGRVGDDLAAAALTVGVGGDVGRDVLVTGGSLRADGTVGRNVRGQFLSAELDGTIGGDVDVTGGTITLGASTLIRGDLVYKSDAAATISGGAIVEGGDPTRLPARNSFAVAVLLKLATVLSFFAFVVSGIALFWLFRNTAPRAVATIAATPWRALGVGFAVLVGLPSLMAGFAVTILGLPLALLALLLLALALVFGPVPAVSVFGDRLLRGRGGLLAAFLLGAVVWRTAIWLIPLFGIALYFAALVWGVGGWAMAAWLRRREGATAPEPLVPATPAAVVADDAVPEAWEPPLPPPGTEGGEPGESPPPAGGKA